MKALRWLVGALQDPVTLDGSSARILAFGCVLLAAFATIYGLTHGVDPVGIAAIDTALVGGGAVALLSRKKADDDA